MYFLHNTLSISSIASLILPNSLIPPGTAGSRSGCEQFCSILCTASFPTGSVSEAFCLLILLTCSDFNDLVFFP